MNTSYILALDIGTSSVRAALYDLAGDVLPETFIKHERQLEITADGGAEIDADEALSQIETAVETVLQKAETLPGEIEYVAVSSFWHSLLGIDGKGAPTTSLFGWADTRSAAFVKDLQNNFDETEIHNRTGARFHSSYWTAKLLWLKNTAPPVFEKTREWLSFSDFFALHFFGETVTSVSMASGTGIFDQRKCVWDESLLDFLELSAENLPHIAEDGATFRLTNEYAAHWPRLKNAKWFLAIGDGAANNIGAGCARTEKAALMIGTSGALRVAFKGAVPARIPSGLWCYRIDRERVIIGGALSDGGGLYRWLKDNFNLQGTDDQIEIEIARRPPTAHGLTFLPFLAGERSTGYHQTASGAVLGLKSATDAVDIVQAALESVAYRFAEIYDQLNEVLTVKEIIASGGALRESPVWTQIICDTLGQKMILPDTREASSRGAVLHALEKTGKISDIALLETPDGAKFNFDKTRHEIYQTARSRHKSFYDLLVK